MKFQVLSRRTHHSTIPVFQSRLAVRNKANPPTSEHGCPGADCAKRTQFGEARLGSGANCTKRTQFWGVGSPAPEADCAKRTQLGLIRFERTSMLLGGSAPKPAGFAAWHQEPEGRNRFVVPTVAGFLPPAPVMGRLMVPRRRIGLCWEATRAPSRPRDLGDVARRVTSPSLWSCLWPQAENPRSPGTASPAAQRRSIAAHARTG